MRVLDENMEEKEKVYPILQNKKQLWVTWRTFPSSTDIGNEVNLVYMITVKCSFIETG